MKIAIVISTNDTETSWNALRLANFSLTKKDTVKVFLLGKGVEAENIGTELCPLSTMNDLYEMVKEADKVLTF